MTASKIVDWDTIRVCIAWKPGTEDKFVYSELMRDGAVVATFRTDHRDKVIELFMSAEELGPRLRRSTFNANDELPASALDGFKLLLSNEF